LTAVAALLATIAALLAAVATLLAAVATLGSVAPLLLITSAVATLALRSIPALLGVSTLLVPALGLTAVASTTAAVASASTAVSATSTAVAASASAYESVNTGHRLRDTNSPGAPPPRAF
jgi:hypothetical protein